VLPRILDAAKTPAHFIAIEMSVANHVE
jgi:hypothetical protein